MPIDCVWRGEPPKGPWKPGECFFFGYALSKHYRENVEQIRRPISVVLATRDNYATPFCIDSHPTKKPDEAWEVDIDLDSLIIGQKPNISVRPSINCVGLYHGYVTNGVIGDDLG